MLNNYNEYLKQIDTLNNEKHVLPELFKTRQEFSDKFLTAVKKGDENEKKKLHAEKRQFENDYKIKHDYNREITLISKIMVYNSKIILSQDIAPVLADFLKKYANKPYGEKTKKAIHDGLKELTNCSVYLYNNYFQILPLDKNGFSVNYDYLYLYVSGGILDGNKIKPLNIENFILDAKIIDDPKKHLKTMCAMYDEIYKQRETLETLINDFNKMCVGVFKNIEYRDAFYNSYLDFYF